MTEKTIEKNNNYATGVAKQWKQQARAYKENRKQIRRAQSFAIELMDYMAEQGIKQNELAKKMGVSAQQVNKILRAKSNLTFETLDKIEDALGITITNPKIKSQRTAQSSVIRSTMAVVFKKPRTIEENISSKVKTSKNPFLETSIQAMDTYKFTADQI